jgi:DNA-binding response OmpR family regulator
VNHGEDSRHRRRSGVLNTIKVLLQRAGCAVEAVDHSEASLQLPGARDFDLMIVDIKIVPEDISSDRP